MSANPHQRQPEPGQIRHSINGTPSATWRYLSASGELLGLICRFDTDNGKEVLPYTFRDGRWAFKGFDTPRPLYNLPGLAKSPTLPVLLVEGEKTADAAQRLFPGYVATCWQGGANGISAVDFSPLKGRDVSLWPDNDKPGLEAMGNVGKILAGLALNVRTISPPDLGKGWDLADAELEGWTPESAKGYLQSNIIKPPEPVYRPAAISTTEHPRVQAERILLGAMIRDVHLMPEAIGSLNTVALSNAANGLAPVFAEIIKQFKETGKYTVASISRKTGNKQLAYIASEETETTLHEALDWWWLQYQNWAQLEAYSAARGIDMLAMREAVAKVETQLGLNWTPKTGDDGETFLQAGLNKLKGIEEDSNMKPPVLALRSLVKRFKKGHVWTISGETSSGKTQFALNLFSSFIDQGAKGKFITLEMSSDESRDRLMGIRHGINMEGELLPKYHEHIEKCLYEVKDATTNRFSDTAFGLSEIEALCLEMHFNAGLDFIFIDLLGYVTAGNTRSVQSTNDEIGRITKALVRLTKRMKFTAFVVHHLNRESKKQSGSRRPQLHHLKDSGSIEQDSYGVIFLYRPAYHGIFEDETGKSTLIKDGSGNVVGDIAEIIVAKHRNGPIGSVHARWSPIRGYRDLEDCEAPAHHTTPEPFKTSRVEPDTNTPF